MKVFQTVPVPAAWLSNALEPVVAACRFRSPPPVELRPTGAYRGWCEPIGMALDGRVSTSGRARFWSQRQAIEVYLHEAAHRLLPGRDHDPAFACLAHAFLLRSDVAGLTDNAASVCTNLYNISDLPVVLADDPDLGLGRSITWSVLNARELAATEMDAEELASEVVRRSGLWVAGVAGEPERRAQRVRQVARQQEVVARLREKARTLKCVIGLLSLLVVSLFVAGFK